MFRSLAGPTPRSCALSLLAISDLMRMRDRPGIGMS
jgi:hypothetical protein